MQTVRLKAVLPTKNFSQQKLDRSRAGRRSKPWFPDFGDEDFTPTYRLDVTAPLELSLYLVVRQDSWEKIVTDVCCAAPNLLEENNFMGTLAGTPREIRCLLSHHDSIE